MGLVLVIVLVFGFVKMTGNVVNETETVVECNIADFNADGIVNFNDRMEFGRIYASSYASKESCSLADLNSDGILNHLDNNEFGRVYNLYEGKSTGDCILRKLACAESEVVEEEVTEETQTTFGELPSEKLGFFQRTRDFFKGLFER